MKPIYTLLIALFIVALLPLSAHAALIDRGNGLIYDSDLNITWLENANLGSQNTFGVSGIGASGQMSWFTALNWVAAMNAANYLGYSNWRLPQTMPVNGSSYNYNLSYNGSTDNAYNVSAPGSAYPNSTGSELAYLFYVNLGNKGVYNLNGNIQGGYGVTNPGPFVNLATLPAPNADTQLVIFWSETAYAPDPVDYAWCFRPDDGWQTFYLSQEHAFYAWPVLPGDPAYPGTVSQPPTINNVVFAVNAGGGSYTSESGFVYQADTDFSGGETSSTTAAITASPADSAPAADSTVYQSERYGNFSYNIPLANGNYTVILKFAETYFNSAGQRIFNVTMQGKQVITNLDIYAMAGIYASLDVYIPVSVTTGTLNISFSSVVNSACVNAIIVTSGTATPPSGDFSPDSTPPSIPSGLSTTVISPYQVNLAWTASTDPVVSGQLTSGLAGYDLYRNGQK